MKDDQFASSSRAESFHLGQGLVIDKPMFSGRQEDDRKKEGLIVCVYAAHVGSSDAAALLPGSSAQLFFRRSVALFSALPLRPPTT